MRRILAIAVLSLAGITACGHSGTGPSIGSSDQAVLPNVGQSGGGDTWERFIVSLYPLNVAPGPDGNMWFTAFSVTAPYSSIVRISMDGVTSSFALNDPYGDFPIDITTGPDGNLWFTDTKPFIGRMTTTGLLLSRYPIPLPGFEANYITSGPDGDLWFTIYRFDDGAGYIGRITTSGKLTLFPIGPKNVNPNGIAVGPDGNVWFADAGTAGIRGTIGRITTSGVMTLFPADPSGPRPRFIVEGGDHQLYYQDMSFHHALVRVDATTGATTRIGHLKPFVFSNAVPIGRDSLWYLSNCPCPRPTLYRLSLQTGGQQPEIVSPYENVFGNIALGPDDNLWIASSFDIDVAVRRSMDISPLSLSLRSHEQAVVSVSETHYRKLFLATSGDTSVLTIVSQNPGPGEVTVDAVNVGNTTLTIQDDDGNHASIPVTVTQ